MVRDLNGNGTIDNGGELFGDQTLKQDGTVAASGFEAISELDSNQDGKISSDDEEFDTLRVWQDKNQDQASLSSYALTSGINGNYPQITLITLILKSFKSTCLHIS